MANRFWVGGSGTWNNTTTTNWSATSGGAGGASAPTTGDTVFFDANSGTAATITVAATAVSAATTVDKSDINLNLSGSPTLCVAAGTFTLTSGALALNTYTLTVGRFSSNNTNVRTIAFGTGNITLSGNNASIIGMATVTGLTITGTPVFNSTYAGATGTRTLRFGNTAGGSSAVSVSLNVTAGTDILNFGGYYKTINLTGYKGAGATTVGAYVYINLIFDSGMTYSGAAGILFSAMSGTQQITTNGITLDCPLYADGIGGTFAFQDALTQGSTRAFTITNGTVQLKNGVTSTVGAFVTSGANQKFLQSTVLGSQATLSEVNGTVDASYLTIRDINATGGATWNAFVNQSNVDAGNNDGWDFGISPVIGGAEYTYQLRSFTQPRRF